MNAKLIQSQRRLRDSLYELYEQGGLELYLAGTRGLKHHQTEYGPVKSSIL
jgi:hypothetical protein